MIRSILAVRTALILVILASLIGGQAVSAQETKEKQITVEGEVVDLFCYMTRHQGEGKGARHAGCTNACIKKGGSVAFVSDKGDLYMLLSSTTAPIKRRVVGLGGKKVRVTGIEIDRDDIEAIKVKRIERVR